MRRAVLLSLAAILVAVGLVAHFAGGGRSNEPMLELTVRDAVTGEPVDGAAFSIVRDGKPYVRSEQVAEASVDAAAVRPSDELLVAAYGYELHSAPLGSEQVIEVALVPCRNFHTLTLAPNLTDAEGTRVSVVQSLRRDPEVMLIHTSKEYVLKNGSDRVVMPVPRGLRSKALALHEGGKPTHPYGFWLTPGGSVNVASVALKSLRVRVLDAQGAAVRIQQSILTPNFAVGAGLPDDLVRSLGVRHLSRSYAGEPDGLALSFEQLPPIPMHLFARTELGWSYAAISRDRTETALEASRSRRLVTSLSPETRTLQDGDLVLPGHLDLACLSSLREAGVIGEVGRTVGALRGGAGDVCTTESGGITVWSDLSGVWHGQVDGEGRLLAARQPGHITVQGQAHALAGRFEVWLTPSFVAQESTRWRSGTSDVGTIMWPLEAKTLELGGLPLGTYRVAVIRVQDDTKAELAGPRASESVSVVALTAGSPSAALRVTDRGIGPAD